MDLGLRSFEVAALRLEDIDWKNATLTIRVGKSQRADVLPLPAVTGHAIANYLHKARPTTESRAVFVRHRAPLDVPVDAGVSGRWSGKRLLEAASPADCMDHIAYATAQPLACSKGARL